MRRSIMLSVTVATALLIAAAVWQQKTQAATVVLAAAEPAATAPVYGLGTVEARRLTKVGFEAMGTLVELLADQGERVTAGSMLARLHTAEQRARLARAEAQTVQAEAAMLQAEARVARAQAVLAQKKGTNQRRQALVGGGTVSRENAEAAEAEARVAAADVTVAERDLDAARAALRSSASQQVLEAEALSKMSLASPFDAIVVERARELGSVLPPGTTVFTLVDPASIWVRAYVDESLAGDLKPGQAATVTLRSRPGKILAGRVARVDVENDRIAEERIVHVAFDQIPEPFHLGEQAEVRISVSPTAGLLLPATALESHDGSQGHVWVVKGDAAERRPVKLGRLFADGRVEVLDGLVAGDKVARDGHALNEARRVVPAGGGS
jgi:HlyD family secretion protein